MSVYIYPIKAGLMIFPVLALIFTIPYIISQYRKYGAMLLTRIVVVYSFILYLLCAYFMVLLPLPKEDIPRLTTTMQLIPFHFVDMILACHFHSVVDFIKNPYVYQAFFNILLTLPLGVYLRYYFKKGWFSVFILGFLMSLSFELLQLTGICGVYQYPYRLFDVDDIIVNTFGAMVGYWITPLLTCFLPSKDKLIEKSYIKGTKVSFIRRLVGFIIDLFVMYLVDTIMICLFKQIDKNVRLVILVFIYFCVIPSLCNGQTIGKKIVKIALRDEQNEVPRITNLMIRYGSLWFVIAGIPQILQYEMSQLNHSHLLVWLIIFICIFTLVYFVYQVFVHSMITHDDLFYEKWSHIHEISIIKEPH